MSEQTDYLQQSKPVLRVDTRERTSQLWKLLQESYLFEVRVETLRVGDYLVDDRVVIERKTLADFALSVIDGRLFAQAAALTALPHRSLFLVEGPRPQVMPRMHPNALKGALLSLAICWRVPVVFSRNPRDSLLCLRLLAEQSQTLRAHRLPTRDTGRVRDDEQQRLILLQGFAGIGPELAHRLLSHFGSIEKIVSASMAELAKVSGLGPKTASQIRALLTGS